MTDGTFVSYFTHARARANGNLKMIGDAIWQAVHYALASLAGTNAAAMTPFEHRVYRHVVQRWMLSYRSWRELHVSDAEQRVTDGG